MQDESRALESRHGGELETLATEIKGLEEQLASREVHHERIAVERAREIAARSPATFPAPGEEER